jgi:LacI family transcriptional regulator
LQLRDRLADDIQAGRYLPGERLPSVRELVRATGLSHLTVARAVADLVREKLVVSERGRGTFVAGREGRPRAGRRRVFRIGVLYPGQGGAPFPDPFGTPFSYEFLLGVSAAAVRLGHRITHGQIQDGGLERAPNLDGAIVLYGDCPSEAVRALQRTPLPVLFVRKPPGPEPASVLDFTDAKGMTAAVEHLAGLGHRRIAMFQLAQDYCSCRKRYEAFCQALAERGLPLDPDLVLPAVQTVAAGYRNAVRLMGLPTPPTACIAGSDPEAVGAIRAFTEAGWRVPERVSVVGFYELGVFAGHHPRLTTVSYPLRKAGYEAVRTLEDVIQGAAPQPVSRVFETRLTVGETTGPAASL